MILATHELVGAAIGAKIHSPWLIIIFSLAMHFVLDTFRHGEYLNRKSKVRDTAWKIALDFSTGFVIILFYILIKHSDPATIRDILLGAFVSVLPDSLTLLYWQLGLKFLKKPFEFHTWIHAYPQGSPERAWTLRNAANDIIFSLIAIIILFIK